MKPLVSHNRSVLLIALAALFTLSLSFPAPAIASDRDSYILFTSGNDMTSMNASTGDLRRASAMRVGSGPFLYVHQDGATYVVRDPATLREAQAIVEPQQALGARQSELGSRQSELGSRQAALGAQQAALGERQADARPSEEAAFAEQQAELGRRQGELGAQQSALGEQQSALGREQARLGRIAQAKFHALILDALRRGVAQRVD